MQRTKQIRLLAECLELARAKRPFMTSNEALIPVTRYTDPQLFELERARLFRSQMNVVAHGSQIASPGDFVTRDIVGTPALIVRHEDGSAKAFVNVCRHRGATVEPRAQGRCKRFVCPYHAWTYGTDGSLVALRHREGFPSLDVEHTSLVELSCFEAAGLVWVCPDPHAEPSPPDDATREILGELEWLGCADSTLFAAESQSWHANWKLIVDGGLESYHFKIAHRDTIAGFFTDNTSTFELLGDHVRSVLPRTSIFELIDQSESEWDIRKHTHLVYSVAPNASVLVQERHLELILFTPLAIDQTRIEIMTVAPAPGPDGFSEKARRFLSANHAFTKETLAEDFELAEQIQRGMHTGANEALRFARFEGALTQWHERMDEKLGRR